MKWFFILLLVLSCSSKTATTEIKISHIEDLQRDILGKSLDEVRNSKVYFLDNLLKVRDTLMQDEGVEWHALIFEDSIPIILAESSWKEKDRVSRVDILYDGLKTKDGIGVGSTFMDLRSLIDFGSWKDFPDGYVAFKDRNNDYLVYWMDISNNPALGEGSLIENEVPNDLRIESITLSK
jgi:hypothetical protein